MTATDKSESPPTENHVQPWFIQSNSVAFVTLLTVAFFLSGFLDFITPLPLIYYQLKNKNSSIYSLASPGVLIITALYVLGSGLFYDLYQSHPSTAWLFPIPFVEIFPFFSPTAIKTIGILYFIMFVVMAHLISRAFHASFDLDASPDNLTAQPLNRAGVFGALFAFSAERLAQKHPPPLSQQDHHTFFKKIFYGIAGVYLAMGMALLFFIFQNSTDIKGDYANLINTVIQAWSDAVETSNASQEQIVYLKSMMNEFIDHSFDILPFFLFMLISLLFVLNLVLSKKIFSLFLSRIHSLNLTFFTTPFATVWIVLALILLMVINKKITESSLMDYTTFNILLCFGVVYFFQGLAVFVHFLDRKNISGLLRVICYVFLLLVFPRSFFLLSLIGFMDQWLDIRKLNKPVGHPV
ncbi:MAG: DUF2232 domain-containing protein [Deltaproteobacteria bacterium]|nr:DUF2232 domain-containing protein [Deltaproteobacteria bacterium]